MAEQAHRARFAVRLEALLEQLDQRLAENGQRMLSLETSLTQRMTTPEPSLNQRMTTLATDLNERISSLEMSLTQRITGMETGWNQSLTAVEHHLTGIETRLMRRRGLGS